MSRLSCFFAAAALSALSFDAAAASPSSRAGVLVSEQGVEVVMVPSGQGNEVLVQVKGVKDPIDNVVLLTTPNDISSRGDKAFRTTLWGSGYAVLIARNDRSANAVQFQLILPSGEEQKLWLDEKKSKALKPDDLPSLYAKQKGQGLQEKLAQFNRDKLIEREQSRVRKDDDAATQACGAPIQTTVDWPSINDADLRELSISGYCQVAPRLEAECRDKPQFKPQAAALGRVECRFGSEMKLRTVDGKVVFTTHREASNLEDFIRAFLRNQ